VLAGVTERNTGLRAYTDAVYAATVEGFTHAAALAELERLIPDGPTQIGALRYTRETWGKAPHQVAATRRFLDSTTHLR
jgi:hypothetical protein